LYRKRTSAEESGGEHGALVRFRYNDLSRLGFSDESAVATWRCGRQLQRISSEHL
jgi:hypothetical protein